MVAFPPYLASSAWYAVWLRAGSHEQVPDKAIGLANNLRFSAKDMARASILMPSGKPMMISMAIAGGARKLREPGRIQSLDLSEHGDWRHNHLMALEAAYGKTPFFIHVMDRIGEIYADKDLTKLRDFNLKIHGVIKEFILQDLGPEAIEKINRNESLRKRSEELARKINSEISVIDSVFKLGHETLPGLCGLRF